MKSNTTLETFEEAGISALVRAGEAKQWFFGHFGASIIAGARLLANPVLPGSAALALNQKLSDFQSRYNDWFSPIDELGESTATLEPILTLLRKSAGTLRVSGHPTIYMSSALHVLSRRPELVTSRVVEALAQLYEASRQDDPARHYGYSDYFAEIDREFGERSPSDHPILDSTGAYRAAFEAMDHLSMDQEIEGRHYFLTGEKVHLVTHAHAIATFEQLGYADIATAASRAQQSLLHLTRASETVEASVVAPTLASPLDPGFWEQETKDPAHVVKLAEAVLAGLPRLADAERDLALGRLGRMWPHLGIH